MYRAEIHYQFKHERIDSLTQPLHVFIYTHICMHIHTHICMLRQSHAHTATNYYLDIQWCTCMIQSKLNLLGAVYRILMLFMAVAHSPS